MFCDRVAYIMTTPGGRPSTSVRIYTDLWAQLKDALKREKLRRRDRNLKKAELLGEIIEQWLEDEARRPVESSGDAARKDKLKKRRTA